MAFASMTSAVESWGRKHVMTNAEFDKLVAQAEEENKRDPQGYKQRVVLLGLLGYAFVFAVVGSVLALTISFAVFYFQSAAHTAGGGKLLLLLLITAGILLSSLWVKYSAPRGISLQRGDCPELFNLIDELCRKLEVRIDQVLLDGDIGINAAVQQVPRLGILGLPRNYLILGYPLLAAESPEMFRATLAHEFGHVSGSHGKTGAWIYTIYTTFSQLLGNLREGSPLMYCIFFCFFHWYNPRFAAYSFVLRRRHEIEADRMAIDIAGSQANALGLICDEIKNKLLAQNFWPTVYMKTAQGEQAPPDIMQSMASFLQNELGSEEQIQQLYEESLRRRTENSDSHPSLIDRLVYAEYPAKTAEEISLAKLPWHQLLSTGQTAATKFLGQADNKYSCLLSQQWFNQIQAPWAQRCAELNQYKDELKRLESIPQPTKGELVSRAFLVQELEGIEQAIPFLQEVLRQYPDHSWANFTLGTHLLNKRDDSGIGYIEKSIQTDVMKTPDACVLLADFSKRRGRYDEAEKYEQRIESFQKDINHALDERRILNEQDQFQAHDKDDCEIQSLKDQLSFFKDVKTAFLVKKYVRHLPEVPCYVLGLQLTAGISLNSDRDLQVLSHVQAGLDFPGDLHVFIVNKKTLEKMKALGPALLA